MTEQEIVRAMVAGMTDAERETERVATVARIQTARQCMIEARRGRRIEEARGWAGEYRAQIMALGEITRRRLPIPSLAKCLRMD